MTEPDERLPAAGTAEPAGEHDPEAAEDFAEAAPLDPAPDDVNHYLKLVGDLRAEPEK
ncbi:MAG TPA: hypothetical protein VI248_00220 [Kineosporiaceae bacterium]